MMTMASAKKLVDEAYRQAEDEFAAEVSELITLERRQKEYARDPINCAPKVSK